MFKKSILKIGLLTLGICLTVGCMNNNDNGNHNDIQKSVSNDIAVVEEDNNENNDSKSNKYSVISETYKEGNISIEYPQFKTKDGAEDDFTSKWNKILKDDLTSKSVKELHDFELDSGKIEYYNMNYEVKTNNKVISLVCYEDYYFVNAAHPNRGRFTYNIDVSTGNKLKLQDDSNFSKYVENIFKNKNYSLKSDVLEQMDAETLKDVKKSMYECEDLEKDDISELKKQLKDHPFYYDGNKTMISFEVPHAYGDYVWVVME